ncbi:MAG: GGDEF domain-containing protein [Clostridia bacterium]|nr:GGDEF domain-containing protein [Clostridia bacterium]
MDNKTLLEKYRAHFSSALALTILVAGSIEILAYIIFINIGKCSLSFTDTYLLGRVILPILLNCGIYSVSFAVNRSPKVSDNIKNEAIVYGASAVAFVISVVHREFIVNTGSFMFPMILSAMFNNKKLMIRTFVFSLLSTTITVVFSWFDNFINLTNLINYIVMYGFLSISFLACYISIKYSQLQFERIEDQEKTNYRLQNIVLRDQMTGLYNHRTFYEELDLALKKYSQDKTDFCLAIIDIDNFKLINDIYGHANGDAVINNLADIIKSNCDKGDKGFRYGGEEFAIIFAKKTVDEAKKVLENILNAFSDTRYSFADEMITFSAGVAKCTDLSTRETFFTFVDRLMYLAKKDGRNQIKTG